MPERQRKNVSILRELGDHETPRLKIWSTVEQIESAVRVMGKNGIVSLKLTFAGANSPAKFVHLILQGRENMNPGKQASKKTISLLEAIGVVVAPNPGHAGSVQNQANNIAAIEIDVGEGVDNVFKGKCIRVEWSQLDRGDDSASLRGFSKW